MLYLAKWVIAMVIDTRKAVKLMLKNFEINGNGYTMQINGPYTMHAFVIIFL